MLWLSVAVISFVQRSRASTAGAYIHITTATNFVGCSVYKISKEENELGCARACGSEDTCVRASYHTITKTCKLTGDKISNHCRKYFSLDHTSLEKVRLSNDLCNLYNYNLQRYRMFF